MWYNKSDKKIQLAYLLLSVAAIASTFGLITIVMFTTPETAGFLVFAAIYICIACACFATFALIGMTFKGRGKAIPEGISQVFRQSLFLTLLIITCLVLSSFGLLLWWVALSVFLFFLTLELFFLV